MNTDPISKPPVREQIEEGLKQVYEAYAESEMPDRFVGLMERLREKERVAKEGGGE